MPRTSNPAAPTGYDEVIGVLESLPVIVREARRRKGLSLRSAAEEIGVSFSTMSRIEAGHGCVLESAIAVLWWAAK